MIRKLIISFFSIAVFLFLCGPTSYLFSEDGAAEPKKEPVKKKTLPFEAGEIVVKERSIANIENATTTTEITDEELRERGDKTLDQALQMVPGMNVYQQAKGNMVFDLRGMQHSKVAILVDGLPLVQEVYYGGGGDISRIPIMNASRIIVSRGVASALYGTSASFGVVNIISKKPETLYAEGNAEYGIYNNYSFNAACGDRLGDFYVMVTATHLRSEGYHHSHKLNYDERKKWVDRLVQYGIYGKTFESITLHSMSNYLNDNGRWNETNYSKWQVSAKMGYEITDKIEAGVSAYYYHNRQNYNSYGSNSTVSFKDSTSKWNLPKDPDAYTIDSKSAIFFNNAFVWPDDYNYTITPYFIGEFGDLYVKANFYFTQQKNVLDPWADQDRHVTAFPSSVYDVSGKSYSQNVSSGFYDTAVGFYLYPSYKLADWNKLNMGIQFKVENHKDKEKALDGSAINVISIHGTDEYLTRELQANYFTLALEDEMRFDTTVGKVGVTVGISYDTQYLTKFRQRSNVNDGSLNTMVAGWIPHAVHSIFGTRDSWNPVTGVTYEPFKDLLKLRAAFSRKTVFPSMRVYAANSSALADTNVKPEVSYNTNVGFEMSFLDNILGFSTDYFYSKFEDKISSIYDITTKTSTYSNIKGQVAQGIESTISANIEKIADMVDIKASFTYVYLNVLNDDNSSATRGEVNERTPRHQLIAQLSLKLFTKTSFLIWGQHTRNQIVYTMNSQPPATTTTYTTAYYNRARLHDPWMLNLKVSQDILENFNVYVMCKNVLDDYSPDPFQPGPGRMFYFGGGAKW